MRRRLQVCITDDQYLTDYSQEYRVLPEANNANLFTEHHFRLSLMNRNQRAFFKN
ncbi:hypothetical protein ACR78F_11335 [Sphingobacterium spiritivorum]|uniref:hypothetical protein n=1 Tax=Sphingobacterium spiritivorum TaxID=258 RepID=UPI003DA4F713